MELKGSFTEKQISLFYLLSKIMFIPGNISQAGLFIWFYETNFFLIGVFFEFALQIHFFLCVCEW